MKFVLVVVSCCSFFVHNFDYIIKLKRGAKELVDICRQVLILNRESVIYEYDREYMRRSKETKMIIKEAIENNIEKRKLNDKEKLAINKYREKWMP